MQPLTLGPEADETKTMAVAACYCLDGGSTAQRARAVRMHSASACAPHHSTTQGRHGVEVQGQIYRRGLHSRVDGLDAADHFLSEGAVRTRLFVTESSGGGTPDECGVAQSSSSELATQRHPSQP